MDPKTVRDRADSTFRPPKQWCKFPKWKKIVLLIKEPKITLAFMCMQIVPLWIQILWEIGLTFYQKLCNSTSIFWCFQWKHPRFKSTIELKKKNVKFSIFQTHGRWTNSFFLSIKIKIRIISFPDKFITKFQCSLPNST